MKAKSLASVAAIAVLLAACAGGGTGSSPTSSAAEQLSALNTISAARTNCGFGALQSSTMLDASAQHHVSWMIKNQTVSLNESFGMPGFTGVDPSHRMLEVGYAAVAPIEVLIGGDGIAKSGFGSRGARALLGVPYILANLMQSSREIGISVTSSGPVGFGANINFAGAPVATWLVADLASSPVMPAQAQNETDALTFPCQGTTNASPFVFSEAPNPIPGRDSSHLQIGQTLLVQILADKELAITAVVITGPQGAVTLLPTLTSASDPNGLLHTNQALIIPGSPLSPNTAYAVNLTGVSKGIVLGPGMIQLTSADPGVPFSRNFAFTTGD